MSGTETGRPLSPGKRILALLVLLIVVAVAMATGLWITGAFRHESEPLEQANSGLPMAVVYGIVMAFFGIILLAAGAGAYALAYVTQCLTFDFSRPFFRTFKSRLYFAHLLVTLLLGLGIALLLGAFLTPMLLGAGLSLTVSFILPLFVIVIMMQLLVIWVQIWCPLETRVIARRLAAMGITPEQMRSGIHIGISDPARSSFRKLTLIEDDIGMLWITPDALIYRGDSDAFDIQRDRFLGLERKADAGSVAALGGAVHVILRFLTADRIERQVRLHPEGCWTVGRKAKAMDALASRIREWAGRAAVA
jgi:hypothetical protein